MYGDSARLTKTTGTRWIDHKIRAMGRVVNKKGLYCQKNQKTELRYKESSTSYWTQKFFFVAVF